MTEVIILQRVCGLTSVLRRLRFGNQSELAVGASVGDASEGILVTVADSGALRSIRRSSKGSPEVSPCHLV